MITAIAAARSGMLLPHEAQPLGVPDDYDWKTRPHIRAKRSDMAALTGWLHAFSMGGTSTFQMCNFQTWVRCGDVWVQVQADVRIEGGVFRPDFAGNAATKPKTKSLAHGVTTVSWPDGVWHCWPRQRAALPSGADEVVVLCQVRAIGDPVLAGCGADYWRDKAISYGDGSNNPGIGMGRLTVIGREWLWIGFSSNP